MNVIIATISHIRTSALIFISSPDAKSIIVKSKAKKVFYEILRLHRKNIKQEK